MQTSSSAAARLPSHPADSWVYPPEETLLVADGPVATLSTQGKAEDCHWLRDQSPFPTPRTALTVKPSCSYWIKAMNEDFTWARPSQKG